MRNRFNVAYNWLIGYYVIDHDVPGYLNAWDSLRNDGDWAHVLTAHGDDRRTAEAEADRYNAAWRRLGGHQCNA